MYIMLEINCNSEISTSSPVCEQYIIENADFLFLGDALILGAIISLTIMLLWKK